MISPTESTDLSFNVVAGAQIFIASWILPTNISNSPVVSGELIVNDILINSTSTASSYNSIKLNDQEMRTGSYVPIPALTNGREYSVRLIVNANAQRYYAPTKTVIPSGVPVKPDITCTGLNNGIQIDILNYSSVRDESNGYALVKKYEVFYNNFCKIYDVSNVLILSSVVNNTEYEIAVRAINDNGISDFSLTTTATPNALTVGVSNFVGTAQDRAVRLTWTPPTGMANDSKYFISKRLGNGVYDADTELSKTVSVTTTTGGVTTTTQIDRTEYTFGSDPNWLVNGSSYNFRIAVYNVDTGYSSYTSAVSSTVASSIIHVPFGKPGVPQYTTTVASGQISIRLCKPTNENGKPVTSYILTQLVNGVENLTPLVGGAIDASGCQTFVITGLTNGFQYSFNAYALNNTNPESKSVAVLINATPYGAPGAVTGLGGLGADQSVTLNWVAPEENGGSSSLMYRVTYPYQTSAAGVSPVTYATETMNGITAVSQRLTNRLLNGVSTTFNVFAYFTVGAIEYTSTSVSFACVPFKAPDRPVVSAGMDLSNNILYSWPRPNLYNLPFEKYMYKVVLSTMSRPQDVSWIDLSTNMSNNTLVVSPPSYGVSYSLYIKTVTKNGALPLVESLETKADTTPYKAPSAVENLAVYSKVESLDVVWDPPSDKGGYTTIRYIVSVNGVPIAESAILSEKITIDELKEAQSYGISVVAQGYIGSLPDKKSVIKSKPGTPYFEVQPPTNFTAIPQISSSVILSWTAPQASEEIAFQYVIFRDDDKIYTTTASELTYQDNNLTRGRAYVYKVMTKQVWTTGYTSYSNFTTPITATPYNVPDAVNGLNVSVGDKSMSVSWLALTDLERNGVSGTVNYDIVVRDASSGLVFSSTSTTGLSASYSTGLENGKAYTVELRARIYNAQISQDVTSAAVTQTKTVNIKPAAPTGLEVIPGDGKLTVRWFAPSSPDAYTFVKYEIYVNEVYNSDSTLNVASGTKNSLDLTLPNGTSNTVKIRRVGSSNSSESYSDFINDSSTKMPFGKPIALSAPVISGKTITFSINPNGSGLIQIMVFAGTNKYTAGDQAYQLAQYSAEPATGTVTKTITLVIADGTVINSVFYALINAAGATTSV